MKLKVLHLLFFQILLGGMVLAQPAIVIEHYLSGFTRPVKITHAYDSRLFVAEMSGRIKVVKNGSILPTPFLDISSKINDPDWAGIYSIAFDPNYLSNGYFYVMYVVKSKFEVQISRFQRAGNATSDIANVSYPSLISFGEDQQGELYVISFFDGTLGKLTPSGGSLPVTLESFTAQPIENSVQLKWSTTMETDFSHFQLEHSRNGREFQPLKSILGTDFNSYVFGQKTNPKYPASPLPAYQCNGRHL